MSNMSNMSTQFLPKLSQNYIELLNDNEYCDVTYERKNSRGNR